MIISSAWLHDVVLHNTSLQILLSLSTFSLCQLYTRDSSRNWKQVDSNGANRLTTKEPSANIVLLDYTSSEKWNDIVDFDDHLDDISK